MSMQVSYKKQILLYFIFFLFALGITEIFLKITGLTDFQLQCKFVEHELFKDKTFFEKRVMCDEYSTIGYDRNDVIQLLKEKHGKYLNINSDGFRGDEIDWNESKYRIFFLGGSTAFGIISSSDELTIPAILEKKLNENGINANVINAGIPNSNSRDERYYIEKYIIKYSPNMIILYDGWNDSVPLRDNFSYDEFKKQPYYVNQMVPDEPITKTGILTFFAKIDYKTGIGISKYLSTLLNPQDADLGSNINQEHLENFEDFLQNNWSEICKMSKEYDFKVINILQPILGSGNRTISEYEKYSKIEFYNPYLWQFELNEEKYHPCENVFDLRDSFNDFDGVTIYFDNGHTSDFGNDVIAEKIYDKIFPIISKNIENNYG